MIPGLSMEGEWRRGKKKTDPGLSLEEESGKALKGQAGQGIRKTILALVKRLGDEFSKGIKILID